MPNKNVGNDTPARLIARNKRENQAVAVDAGINAHRHADRDRDHRRGEGQFQRGRQPLGEQARNRLREPVAEAELAVQHGPEVIRELDEKRLIQAELMDQGLTLRLGMILAQKDRDGVSHVGEQREGNQADDEQNRNGLQQTCGNEREHAAACPLSLPLVSLGNLFQHLAAPERAVKGWGALLPWCRPPSPIHSATCSRRPEAPGPGRFRAGRRRARRPIRQARSAKMANARRGR